MVHINPFVATLTIPYNFVITKYELVDGEVQPSGYEVETTPFARLYLGKSSKDVLKLLSAHGRDLFFLLPFITNREYQYVILTHEKVLDYYGEHWKSKRRFSDTVRELIRLAVLIPRDRTKSEYWYNPTLFVSGNRLRMFPDNKLRIATIKPS